MTCVAEPPPPGPTRRNFFKEGVALVIGAVVTVVPALAGLRVLLDPLRRKSGAGGFVQVATLTALPEDGVPRKFPVVTTQVDAWNRVPDVPVGAVYLRRTGPNVVRAFNVVCPHAGCFVDYKPATGGFLCPCHNSVFAVDGRISSADSPAPRGLDELEVEVRGGSEVWVRFQNFRAGVKEKLPA